MHETLKEPLLKLEPLPPKEAIKFFKNKVILPAQEFYSLEAWARSRAFTVTHVTKAEVLNDIFEAVDDAIQQGITLKDFGDQLQDIMEQRGWGGTSPWHEEVIFRTNIQTAYSVGREQQLEGMHDEFDGQFDAVMDDRTTDVCSELNGQIYPLDHPIWDIYWPPNHFNCRSSVRPLHKLEEQSRGLEVQSEIPSDLPEPGKGFDVNPAKVPYKPDLSKMPDELRAMVEKDLANEK